MAVQKDGFWVCPVCKSPVEADVDVTLNVGVQTRCDDAVKASCPVVNDFLEYDMDIDERAIEKANETELKWKCPDCYEKVTVPNGAAKAPRRENIVSHG